MNRFALTCGALLVAVLSLVSVGRAAVVVIANRTPRDIQFELAPPEGEPAKHRIAAGDVLPLPVSGGVALRFATNRGPQAFELAPNSAYFFHDVEGAGLDFEQIGLHGHIARRPVESLGDPREMADVATVTVRVYVDEEERMTTDYWQKRLTERIEVASDLFERYCRVRFKIVAFGTWPSDDKLNDFQKSLRDFEQKVTAHPADLAIGFTSQYAELGPTTELGGTRAPFHPYVLIREWARIVSEPERLEILVHELGHYLGATHSPELDSVMRPRQGDRRARLLRNRIGFDPVNTLILYMIGEEMRTKRLRRLSDMSLDTRLELRSIYHTLAQALPEDNASPIYVRLLEIVDRPMPITPGAE